MMLHASQCGLSDQITIEGDETIYDVLHVIIDRQKKLTYEIHTLCGKALKLEGLEANVVHVGHSMKLWNSVNNCPTCGKVCEA